MFKYNDSSSPLSSILSKASLDSIEDEEIEPWHGLIQKLSPFHLDSLHAVFKESKYKCGTSKKQIEKGLTKEEFVAAIDEVFGNCKHSLQATILFTQIDIEEKRTITWDQFLDFVIKDGTPKFDRRLHMNVANLFSPPHVQRDTISKIVLIETSKYFCYAILSKYGCVGLYDGNMNFLSSYYVIMSREDIDRKDIERRRRNRWITDAIFLEDVLMLIITSSARNITIYDASGLKHVVLWLILGVPNIIHCFAYHSNNNSKTKVLFMGDDSGQVVSLTFLKPKDGLLRKKHNDKLSLFYWIELQNEKEFLTIKYFGKLHEDSVKELYYYPDNNSLASCSRDANCSVIIKHQENRRRSYIFKMKRGASCFSLSRLLKVMVTGSDDGTIRLWNITVPIKPIGILKNHQHGIVDVKILELQELFITCSRDGVLKLWDIKEQKCVQTIKIKFPSFGVLGKAIEWGINSIHAGPKRHHLQKELESETHLDKNNTKNESGTSSGEITDPYLPKPIWERSHIYVTCCNYMANISMKFDDCFQINFDNSVFPPPPLQNSVLIPTTWKICEDSAINQREDAYAKEPINGYITEHLKSLKFILDKDLIEENDIRNDINYRIATLETKKLQMKDAVSKCAPYLALNLQEIEEIRLNSKLPVPNSKRIKNLVEKTQRMLSDATLRSQILSERSSSNRSRSSRSSIMTFD